MTATVAQIVAFWALANHANTRGETAFACFALLMGALLFYAAGLMK